MRHPRHRPPNRPYRLPGRNVPYAPHARAVRPSFAFEAHPDPDLIARIVRPDDGHELSIIQAPRCTIGEDANFAAGLGEVASVLVVAVEYIDGLIDDGVTKGLSESDATRQAIQHLIGLAANVLRQWQ